MLYGRMLPPSGGNTCFSNQYMAYETLPEDVKQKIEGKTAVHDASRNSAGTLRPGVKLPTKPSEVPGPHHPLVCTHPESGRKALYLGRRRVYPSQYIDDMEEEESEALLDFLWEHASRDELVWAHVWRLGDVLLWDNRCHHALPRAPRGHAPRPHAPQRDPGRAAGLGFVRDQTDTRINVGTGRDLSLLFWKA